MIGIGLTVSDRRQKDTGLEERRMKNTVEMLDELQNRALHDDALKKRFKGLRRLSGRVLPGVQRTGV